MSLKAAAVAFRHASPRTSTFEIRNRALPNKTFISESYTNKSRVLMSRRAGVPYEKGLILFDEGGVPWKRMRF